MEATTEDNSNICGEGSSMQQNNLKKMGTVQGDDDGEDFIGSLLNVKGNSAQKELTTKPKSVKEKRLETWTFVVNAWKNRDKVPFHSGRIAKKLGVSKLTMWRIIKRFKKRGEVRMLPQTGRRRTEVWGRMEELKEILKQEPNITMVEVARRLDLSRPVAGRMMKECKFGPQVKVEEGASSKKFQGTSTSSTVTAPAEEHNDYNYHCGWEGDDLQGNGNRAPCFICDAVDKNVLDSTLTCGEMTTSLPVEVERGGRVIWFLKDVLRMRDDDLANVMKEARGTNPDSWGISVCTDPECEGAVERSFALWKEIKRLEGELKKCRKRILERIRSRCSFERMSEDDRALLNARVQERVKRGMTEADSMDLQKGPDEPQVKIEPQDEEFDDLDDFTTFEAPNNDNVWDLKDVKVEADDNNGARCRRSSRRKRRTDKFTYEKLGSGANTRPDLSAMFKGKSKLKRGKPKKKENKEVQTAVRISDEKMYSCQSCPALEKMDMHKFIAHLAFHSSYPNKCTACNVHFPEGAGNDQVQKHWEERHPGTVSDSPKLVQVPSAVAAGNIWACSGRKCSKLFGSTGERDSHELLFHEMPEPKKTFRCTTCSSQFRDMTELRFHRAIEHPKDAMLSCCYCSIQFEINSGKEGFKFLNLDQLKQHISQKHHDQMFVNFRGERTKSFRFLQTCHICGLVFDFVNYAKLDNHIAREHGQKLHETYSCPVCSKKMKHADAWLHAKLYHWADKRLPCRFCGKVFRKEWNRKEHEQIHENKDTRPFQCELCGSSFAVRQYLRIHKRVTHERRPFPSALKKKQQSRKGTSEVPSNPGESLMKGTENETVKPGQNEGLTGSVTHRDLQYDSCSWFVSSLPTS